MKMRTPVDLQRAVIEAVPPFAQACRRKLQAGGILANSHAAPVHCFHMHRPERLDCTRTDVCAHRIAPLLTPFAVLSPLLAPLFPAQFKQVFRMLTGFFLADEMLHPAAERLNREPVLAAINRAIHPALMPRLDVQRPIWAVCFFPGPRCPRRSYHVRENPIWNDAALSESRARFGRLHPTD